MKAEAKEGKADTKPVTKSNSSEIKQERKENSEAKYVNLFLLQ